MIGLFIENYNKAGRYQKVYILVITIINNKYY